MKLKKSECFLRDGKRHLFTFIIFLGLFCSVSFVQGQTMSITAPVPLGDESDTGTAIRFRIAKGSSAFAVPSYTVNYSITSGPGTTSNGVDHTNLSGSVDLTGGTGVTFFDIFIAVEDDDLVEGTESLTLVLAGPSNGDPAYVIHPTLNTATANIADNDEGLVSLDVVTANFIDTVVENGTDILPVAEFGQFRPVIDKANGSVEDLTVSYTIAESATGPDYNLTNAVNLIFVNNGVSRARNIRVAPINNTVSDGDKTVTLTLTGTDNPLYTIGSPATATITILDDDCPAGDAAPDLENDPMAFCDVAGVNLNAYFEGTAPAGAPLRWSLIQNPSATADLLTTAMANNAPEGTYYAVFWSNAQQCASASTALTITIGETPEEGTARTGLFSCNTTANGGTTTFDLDTALTGADVGGDWTFVSAPTGGSPEIPNAANVVNFNNNASGNYVFLYTLTAVAPCNDQTVNVTIAVSDCDPCVAGNAPPELNTTVRMVFCDEIDVSLSDYTDSVAPAGSTLTWSTSSNLTNQSAHLNAAQIAQPLAGTYYGFFYDAANDCASAPLTITLTLNTAPVINSSEGNTVCGTGTDPVQVAFTATASGNPTYNWYTAETGGTLAGAGTNFRPEVLQTTTYYLEATENGCPTSPRIAVTATVIIQPSAGTPVSSPSSCNNPQFGDTTLDLDDLLSGADSGEWSTLGSIVISDGNVVDFNGRPDGEYIFTFKTNSAEAPCVEDEVTIAISVSSCDTDDDGDGLFGGVEAGLGTDPNNADSDGDGISDGVEVGPDINNPLDEDEDGIIDALDSNIADADNDGVVDQLDPANMNACVPDITNSNCNDPIDLEVLKVVDNLSAVVGDEITFTITVNNLGPRAAKSIVVGDFLETGFEYESHFPSSGIYDVSTGQWQLEDLASGESETLSINVTVIPNDDGIYNNTAELLSSSPSDDNLTNNSSTVTLGVEQPDEVNLIIEKTARLGPDKQRLQMLTGLVNDIENTLTVEYFIKVINKSKEGSVSNISVRDVFETDSDVEFEIVVDPEKVPEGSSFVNGNWNISRELGVNDEIELSYTVIFKGIGTVVNTAQIIAPQETDPSSEVKTSSVTVEITTRNELEIGILYNQFSPNLDGINDVLKVNRLRKNEFGFDELVDIEYSIDIYDRYGNRVFEASGLTVEQAWDGTYKGKQVPDGTYFYGLNITSIAGEPVTNTSKGWIQLIR